MIHLKKLRTYKSLLRNGLLSEDVQNFLVKLYAMAIEKRTIVTQAQDMPRGSH